MDMQTTDRAERVSRSIQHSAAVIASLEAQAGRLCALCDLVISTLRSGGKLLTAGNGGSAAEAFHMAEEFVGRFRGNRMALPAVCLAADGTALTCIANDFGYDCVFSRQVEGLGRSGDLLVLFSTSGSAANLALALDAAGKADMRTACILGRDGGALAGRSDVEIIVADQTTERIQEAHQVILHLVLEAVEEEFTDG